MSTDPYSGVNLDEDISITTYSELIVVKQEKGTAFNTICVEESDEIVCDDGPSPKTKLRELAFNKKTNIRRNANKLVYSQATPAIQETESKNSYKLDKDNAIRSLSAIRSQSVLDEYRSTIVNFVAEELECNLSSRVINRSNFNATRNGWAGGVLDVANSALKINAAINNMTISQTFSELIPGTILYFKGRFGNKQVEPSDSDDLLTYYVTMTGTKTQSLTGNMKFETGSTFEYPIRVPADGIITCSISFVIRNAGVRDAAIDELLVCGSSMCKIDILDHKLELNGMPNKPLNIYASFIKYTIRDSEDSAKIGYVYHVPNSVTNLNNASVVTLCNSWTSQIKGINHGNLKPIKPVSSIDIEADNDIKQYRNWIWCTPKAGSTGRKLYDYLSVSFPQANEPSENRIASGQSYLVGTYENTQFQQHIIESVEIFYLMNVINPSVEADYNPNGCITQANELVGTISYKSTNGRIKDSIVRISIDDIYTDDENPSIPKNWINGESNGLVGNTGTAKWYSFPYVFDLPEGSGDEQCTTPDTGNFVAQGNMNIVLPKLKSNMFGVLADKCVPSINITKLSDGSYQNDTQELVLPEPSGGTYQLTIQIDNDSQTTDQIQWDSTAQELKNEIEILSNVGTGNVLVTGSGTNQSPFLIEFTGDLRGRNVAKIIGDSSDLEGTGSAVVETIQNGTLNERQKLSRTTDVVAPYKLTFNGQETIELQHNSSINTIQSALDGLSTIGVGNINVSGIISNRDIEYTGVLYFDFTGLLADQNVPTISISSSSSSYVIEVEWNGGVGVNETQEISINADSGTFKIELFDPDGVTGSDSVLTSDIQFDASSDDVKTAILNATEWYESSDISVTKPEDKKWVIVFGGVYSRVDIDQCKVDSSGLSGGTITVTTISQGLSTKEKQKVEIINATSGTFKLLLKVPNVGTRRTVSIPYNADGAVVADALQGLEGMGDYDVNVIGSNPYIVEFPAILGDLDLMTYSTLNLRCDLNSLSNQVPNPPYSYDVRDYVVVPDDNPLNFGGDDPVQHVTKQSANRFDRLSIEFDYFNPNLKINGNRRTLKDIILTKGIKKEDYNFYTMDCNHTELRPISNSTILSNSSKYIIIEKYVDDSNYRKRILTHINNRQYKKQRSIIEC